MMYPSYDQLEITLSRVDAVVSAAEMHGMLCGLYVAAGDIKQDLWLPHVLDDDQSSVGNDADFSRLSAELVAETIRQIDDIAFEFRPLLPNDQMDLVDRTEALGEWSQGVIFGLGLGGLQDNEVLSDNCREFISDLVQIARVDGETVPADEVGETALSDLFEYLRVGLLLLREDLAPEDADDGYSGETLH